MIVILFTGLALVLIGLAAIASTRNLVKIIIGLQSMNLGAMLILSLSIRGNLISNEVAVLLIAVSATASEVVSLSLIVSLYRKLGTMDIRKISKLRW